MALLSKQQRQRIAGSLERSLLTLTVLLLRLELRELKHAQLALRGLLVRSLLILKEVREPRESGHISPHIVNPYEFPPPE
ncbi:hypothetical protein DIE04_19180 [Burkholderia sp. Bp8994]|uniref:hypothetical protein n=1 Tax=Burkholderia sp. Bp8994 TaxID=2184555 RepID=UPI000F5939AC|nr:hypothetical protein [Burkholderia sp. Bp8994]RQR94578.1 hypothetical protein DIE04_19180 [Burkholderia sp. Bp8994]